MRMAISALCLGASLLGAAAAEARGALSCSQHRAVCESVCTPDRVARYHGGLPARCTASCEPRWNECLRTGIWADLERRSTGWWEQADRY